MLHYDLRLR